VLSFEAYWKILAGEQREGKLMSEKKDGETKDKPLNDTAPTASKKEKDLFQKI